MSLYWYQSSDGIREPITEVQLCTDLETHLEEVRLEDIMNPIFQIKTDLKNDKSRSLVKKEILNRVIRVMKQPLQTNSSATVQAWKERPEQSPLL